MSSRKLSKTEWDGGFALPGNHSPAKSKAEVVRNLTKSASCAMFFLFKNWPCQTRALSWVGLAKKSFGWVLAKVSRKCGGLQAKS